MNQVSKEYALNAKETFKVQVYSHFLYSRIFYYVFLAIELIVYNQIGHWHRTDLLVLCIPILFPLFMIYLIWIQSRNPSLEIRRRIQLKINDQQFQLSDEIGNSSTIVYSYIKTVKTIGGCYLFLLKNNTVLYIPKRILSAEEETFINALKLGVK